MASNGRRYNEEQVAEIQRVDYRNRAFTEPHVARVTGVGLSALRNSSASP